MKHPLRVFLATITSGILALVTLTALIVAQIPRETIISWFDRILDLARLALWLSLAALILTLAYDYMTKHAPTTRDPRANVQVRSDPQSTRQPGRETV
ncbi:MAG: hypothetical protein WC565_06770 [Parcubacteria group bacterium]